MSNDYDAILARMLNRIPDNLDKRPNNPIFTGVAPTAAEIAQLYIALEIFQEQTFLLTATGENLDRMGAERGIARGQATHAIRIAEMVDTDGNFFNPPIGSRFSTPNTATIVNFTLIEHIGDGRSLLEAETEGTVGNQHLGALLPLFAINNLRTATMIGTQIPAENQEIDDDYRKRILDRMNLKSFAGNIAAYKSFVSDIPGVGRLKVFPVWDGGGTVLLSIVDAENNPVTSEFIQIVKDIVDPALYTGEGVGTAPIGHRVTVKTPIIFNVNVEATITVSDITIGQAQASIEDSIETYFQSIRAEWADSLSTWIYVSRIVEAILRVDRVVNVRDVKLNGSTNDIELIDTPETQRMPYLGTVILHE